MKPIVRNFLIGFVAGSLGLIAWSGTAVQAQPQYRIVDAAY